ncbi:DUF3679 domain-containing protein [Aquibacillus salsiterrae]|uniref:YqxA family protein n=1 Tax=Aquibacillus salsiterrae TaxID=2950439 RepID=A0A9X3WEH5_9BACI|nr:DUF3679 domain-containing protein [Aquibacillus salsiterrae]MDC3415576.1 YqxA family protein [Aquibacillus salsiterrae]
MLRIMTMFLLMVVLFLGGVVFGIDRANKGVANTRGYSPQSFNNAIEVDASSDDQYEIKVMGENIQQVDLRDKQEKYEAIQSNHFTQALAGNLEYGVKWFYNKMIQSAYQLTQSFF